MESALDEIEKALETVRPLIQLHDGDIELVKFEDDIVYIRFHGACVGCPLSVYTLKLGIEQAIREKLPHIKQVVEVDQDS